MSTERELLEECKTAILANIEKWQYKDEVALYNVLQKIEAELAKPNPEPNAFVPIHPVHGPLWANFSREINENFPKNYSVMEVYTSPPARKPLSDDEIKKIILDNGFEIKPVLTDLKPYVYAAARAIEKAHGIVDL